MQGRYHGLDNARVIPGMGESAEKAGRFVGEFERECEEVRQPVPPFAENGPERGMRYDRNVLLAMVLELIDGYEVALAEARRK